MRHSFPKSTRKGTELDGSRLKNFVNALWDDAVVPSLIDYIRIPNKSPGFDKDWMAHGYMDAAVALMEKWAQEKIANIAGATLEVVRLADRTPVIFIEIPGVGEEPVLLYGHLDKQPEFTGWSEGLGPWTPVLRGDRLYGRGGADDGYAMYGALAAILALHDQNIPHARCVVLIEACEESGSFDLPFYVDHLAKRIGSPGLVICLDSGCGDYERLWLTTSLRGTAIGRLTVNVLTEGVHSGDASGIVPSSFRIARMLLSRLEDEATGTVKPGGLYVDIPPARVTQAKAAAAILGDAVYSKFPFAGGTRPMADDPAEMILNRTWRPQLAVIGADGMPTPANAGAVLLPSTVLKISMRLPPQLDSDKAMAVMVEELTRDPPYGAQVTFKPLLPNNTGWHAPELAPWLEQSITRAGQAAFGKPMASMGEGGTIPFMAMLGEKFPKTQFVITGVLGPNSNAHGPNEFLHIPTGKRVSETIARVLADHLEQACR
jgi:acetylornithine deacetylase/succinyl-diaminopimelate desuccinylase-like protein